VLDDMARRAGLGPSSHLLELCSGQGAACRYLAERTGCAATGVEMNPRQVKRARQRLREASPHLARRVRFVECDALAFRPRRRYDAVLSVDSLMLIPDVPAFLAQARAALRPGGALLTAVIGAGPALEEPMRRFAWEVDGMISLLAAEEYRALLAAAGFTAIEVEDATPLAIASSEVIAAALATRREEIVSTPGERTFRGWVDVGEIYLEAFRRGQLAYYLFTACVAAPSP
jgi:sarcosine/dimethylglycine N-methyltransferase